MSRVSPWQVELVPPIQLPPFSFPKKKVRLSRPSETLDGNSGGGSAADDDMPWHMMNSLYGYVDTVVPPARMQGARHEVPDYRVPLQSPKFQSSTGHGFFLNNFYRPPPPTPHLNRQWKMRPMTKLALPSSDRIYIHHNNLIIYIAHHILDQYKNNGKWIRLKSCTKPKDIVPLGHDGP